MFKSKIISFLLLFSVISVFSDSVYIPFSSYHMYKERDNKVFVLESGKHQYNEFNPGIIYKWDNDLKLGAYKNSEYKWSALLGYDVGLYNNDYIDFGISLNLVTGYSERLVMFMPTLYIEVTKNLRIDWSTYLFTAIESITESQITITEDATYVVELTHYNKNKFRVNVFGFSYKLN